MYFLIIDVSKIAMDDSSRGLPSYNINQVTSP